MPHKLLLADDSVTIQRVIELTFADEDVQVIAVGNGQDAIDRVLHDRPDIILADVGMPERNGYEVAAFVKENPETAHIPVVLLTGAFEPVDEGRARAVGCDGVLVKPFEPQIVISRVKDLLAGNKPAGMWSAAPIAQGPVRQAAGGLETRPAPAASGPGDPLEAYFDQLDAAFASTGTTAGADPFAGLAAVTPAPIAQAAPETPEPTAAAAPSPRPVEGAAPLPASLVDAFAALLEAEQKIGLVPPAATTATPPPPAMAPAPLTEEAIEEISARVLARLTAQARPTILDVAEKLVREELERIKQAGS